MCSWTKPSILVFKRTTEAFQESVRQIFNSTFSSRWAESFTRATLAGASAQLTGSHLEKVYG